MLANDFITQFHVVFDENYKINCCGRTNTLKLISLAEKIRPNVDFGDDRGFMNVENMIKLYEDLK
jgi:hypothetical protein